MIEQPIADDTPPGRYRADALRADHLRAAAGLVLTLAPFLVTRPHPLVAVPLLACACVFALFGARALLRALSTVRMDEAGLSVAGPWPKAIRWSAVSDVRVAYYSTRRDRAQGWFHLTVRGDGARIDVESTLSGFEAVAARVAEAARANRLPLTETTRENLMSLGHHVPAFKPPAQPPAA